MNLSKLFLVLLVAASLSSCQQEVDLGPLRDVPYYTANPIERTQMIGLCESDPGRLDAHSNCVNARASQWNQVVEADSAETKGVPRIPKDFHENN